ncbi:MAG TPA: GNAT family N-acetyltransferase [Solirubrobacteraceae bacterium]|nr:GNAT family N-acetyltransferase [Solirubrobacteraceae bacterium]
MAPRSNSVAQVTAQNLGELLVLMRAYCDFYETAPADEALLDLSRALLEHPDTQGVQLIARDERSAAAGFATLLWSWDTTEGARVAIMHDLFVAPPARGRGVAEQLIEACVARCLARGAVRMDWQTAPENARAQAVYDRIGGVREPWLLYTLAVS